MQVKVTYYQVEQHTHTTSISHSWFTELKPSMLTVILYHTGKTGSQHIMTLVDSLLNDSYMEQLRSSGILQFRSTVPSIVISTVKIQLVRVSIEIQLENSRLLGILSSKVQFLLVVISTVKIKLVHVSYEPIEIQLEHLGPP